MDSRDGRTVSSMGRSERVSIASGLTLATDRLLIEGIADPYVRRESGLVVRGKDGAPRRGRNHFVDAYLDGLLWACCGSEQFSAFYTSGWYIRAGSDTATVTAHDTTALAAPYATAPTVANGSSITNPSPGVWEFSFTATWATGAMVGPVGEFGIWMKPPTGYSGIAASSGNPTTVLCARVSVADGSFTTLNPGGTDQLGIPWTIRITYS